LATKVGAGRIVELEEHARAVIAAAVTDRAAGRAPTVRIARLWSPYGAVQVVDLERAAAVASADVADVVDAARARDDAVQRAQAILDEADAEVATCARAARLRGVTLPVVAQAAGLTSAQLTALLTRRG
jgi:hypothetical protein